ncbi:hypothetical protein KYTH86_04260 [Helicobacter pylori]
MTEERIRENFKNLGVLVVYCSLHDLHKQPIDSFFLKTSNIIGFSIFICEHAQKEIMQKVASRHTDDSNKFNIKPKEKIDENVINALETSLKFKGVVLETLESIKEAKNNKEYENLSNRGFLRAKLDQGVGINFQESLGYNLSALQKKAISLLKISPNQILELVQKLYMKGHRHISYPTEYLFEETFKKNLYKIYKDSENDCFNKNVADEEKVLLGFPNRKFTPNELFTAVSLILNAREFCLYINLKKKETNV